MSDLTALPSEPATVTEVLARIAERLAAAGVVDPEVDAQWLVGHVLEAGRGAVQTGAIIGTVLTTEQLVALAPLVERRERREPLQHITGLAAFRGLMLKVGPGVFVPRPETEGVAQFAIDALRAEASPAPIGIDLGTGSGAIALAMATEVPHARVFAAEISPDAFPWTRKNFDEVGAPNATLVHADLAVAFAELDGTADVVISNPPYVPDAAIPRDPEVRNFDPALALYGGPDGLDVVRVLSTTAQRLLRPGGVLIIEHGELQGRAIRDLLAADGWRATATHPDLTMRDRVTTALRP